MKNFCNKHYLIFLLVTIITLFASRHTMVLLHEWTHSSTAWILGHKEQPLAIHYGNWTLLDVNENVDYNTLYTSGQSITASLIAVSALLTNLLLFLLCILLLSLRQIKQNKWMYQFIFWFAVMNIIGELFSYVPVRTFVGNRGDIGHFVYGLKISPWAVFLPGIAIVGISLWHLFAKEIPKFFRTMSLNTLVSQRIFLGLTVMVIFFWFGASAFNDYGPDSVRSVGSLIAIVTGIAVFFISSNYSKKIMYILNTGLGKKTN